MTGHQKNNLSVLTMGHGRHLDRVSRPISSPKIWFLSDPGIPASRSKVSTLTVFVLYPLPRLLWSALTKLDGGGEENVVSDVGIRWNYIFISLFIIQFLHQSGLFADTNYLFELYVYILIILYFMQRRLWIDLFILFLDLTHLEVEDMK